MFARITRGTPTSKAESNTRRPVLTRCRDVGRPEIRREIRLHRRVRLLAIHSSTSGARPSRRFA
jgi:hypothetical protein